MPLKAMHKQATAAQAHSPSRADSAGALTARAGHAAWGRADLGQVKDEPDWENEAAACGVSEAHARAQLYRDHIVKDELVLGPEILQPPDVMLALREAPPAVVKSEIPEGEGTSDNLLEEAPPAVVKSEISDDDGMSDVSLVVWHDGAGLCARSLSLRARAQLPMTCAVRHKRLCSDDRRATHEVEVHTDSVKAEAYTCDPCGKQFSKKSSLIRHVLRHTGTASISKRLSRKSIITKRTHTNVAEKSYTCEICDKEFKVRGTLMAHTRSIHDGIKPYSCDICNKRFAHKGDFNKHTRIHTGQKPYSCDICNKRFSHKQHLNRHVRIHTGQKSYSCDTCNKQFTQKEHLNTHVRIHTGQKPYSCDICNKQFTRRGYLNIHVRIHTGHKPYSCDICKKRFNHKQHINRHVRIHTGQKSYSCDTCNKQFTRKEHLNRHISIHTGQKPYSCHTCNKLFADKSNLKGHMKLHESKH